MSFIKDLLGFQDAPPPDPQIGEAAKSNAAIAGRVQDLAETQYADQKAIYDKYLPTLQDSITKSTIAQDKATAQSDSAWADYTQTWKPVEHALATRSLAYGSPDRINQEADRAGATAQEQVDNAQRQTETSLAASGASPEKIASILASGRAMGAKTIAGARYQGSAAAEDKSMGYLDNAARFGRNMPSTGLATAQLASQSGAQAVGGVGSIQQASGAAAQSAAPLFAGAVNANNSVGGLANTSWNQQNAGAQSNNGFIGDLIGAGTKVAGMIYGYGSSRKIKHVGKKVDGKKAALAIEKTPSSHWAYKDGMGDGNTRGRMGPIAEDVAANAPEVSDGHAIDVASHLGLHHAALGSISKRLRALEHSKG